MNKIVTLIIFFLLNSILLGQVRVVYELNNNYFILEKNNKYSISKDSTKGNFTFDTICKSKFEDYLFTKQNNQWGIIDMKGKTIIPNEYDNINSACCYDNLNGKDNFIVRKTNKVGIINYKNKIVIPIIYEKLTNWVEYGPKAHYVFKNNKIGVIKHNGEFMIPIKYDSLYYENNDIIKGKLNNKIGVINSKNKIIIPFEYDKLIIDFDKYGFQKNHINKFVVRKEKIWYFLNYDGKIIRQNIPEIEIEKEFPSFELKNSDFEYIGKQLNKNIKNYF
jgi:hypothetical protein